MDFNSGNNKPCKICGCTENNLIDGYYYCVECGTQDTNVRETVIDYSTLGDGVIAIGNKKRLTLVPQVKKAEMSDDWYKWHSLNFLLQGLANEVIECGAAPSFKTKLLWIWTRYMAKYQNKADFGLEANEEGSKEEEKAGDSKNDTFDEDEEEEEMRKTFRKHVFSLKNMNMSLVMTFLYVALNLDRSHIQLTHLIRFIKEGRISIIGWQKHVPDELRPKRLTFCLLFHRAWFIYSYQMIRNLGMELIKKLDLGTPIVPDLRPLVKNYMRELCLPDDMIPLVHSLMFFRRFEYLDVHLHCTKAIPAYELYVMTHILCAIKICFGCDGLYEEKLSNAIDKINEREDHPKSYNSEMTDRLFSFKEWFKYLQFRKSQLSAHTLYLGSANYQDMDDYVAFEHQDERPDYKKTLKDEIGCNVINKLPECEINVIPKSEFPATITPYDTYTRVIANHMQDPIVKNLITEDFTKYSLRYLFNDAFLVDPDAETPVNLITGVDPKYYMVHKGKLFRLHEKEVSNKVKFNNNMIYVKDCENHNWLTTQRPTFEHISILNKTDENDNNESLVDNKTSTNIIDVTTLDNNDSNTIDQDVHEKVSECNTEELNKLKSDTVSDIHSVTTVDINEFVQNHDSIGANDSKIFNESNKTSKQQIYIGEQQTIGENLCIREEDEGVNIFDDIFDLDTKKENEPEDDEIGENEPTIALSQLSDILSGSQYNPETQHYYEARDSDASSDDSMHINPASLDRNTMIKELVIHACNKLKVSIPGKYICRPKTSCVRKKRYEPGLKKVRDFTNKAVKDIVSDYHTHMKQDIFLQMSTTVQTAVAEFNQSIPEESMDVDEPLADNNSHADEQVTEIDAAPEANTTETEIILDTTTEEYKLFDDDSDGETHAEDLLPKKNPKFDEETHDTSQLYLKPAADEDIPEMKLSDRLLKIIDEKIKDEKEEKLAVPSDEDSKSDVEEHVPLSVVRELKLVRQSLYNRNGSHRKEIKGLRPLFKNSSSLQTYKYWFKHYTYSNAAHTNADFYKDKAFARELKNFPSSFVTVLQECSDVVGYAPYNLYKSLQRVEACIKDKYEKKMKLFIPRYFDRKVDKGRGTTDTY